MVEPNEYDLIKFGERGTCLYRCGNERYLLLVQAPEYKAEIFGSAGEDSVLLTVYFFGCYNHHKNKLLS